MDQIQNALKVVTERMSKRINSTNQQFDETFNQSISDNTFGGSSRANTKGKTGATSKGEKLRKQKMQLKEKEK